MVEPVFPYKTCICILMVEQIFPHIYPRGTWPHHLDGFSLVTLVVISDMLRHIEPGDMGGVCVVFIGSLSMN